MASQIAIVSLLLLLVFISIPFVSTQDSDDASPDMAICGAKLLSLTSCAPFVQGSIPSPLQPCCDGITDVYEQEPDCLCFLLSSPTITELPNNRTLALQLPDLCGLSPNTSVCTGLDSPPDASSSQSPVSEGTNQNTSVTAALMAMCEPVPKEGFESTTDASVKLKIDGEFLLATIAVLLLEIFLVGFD